MKTHASLFSGIGGAELAAEWMGWKNVFHCEINPFGRKVLEYWYPNSISYEDITKTDFSEWRGKVNVLTGGFPCQPFSVAGKRRGSDDDRYLWPEMLRVIREVQPSWIVGENVAGILTMVQPGEETCMGCQTNIFGEVDRKRVLLRQEYVIEIICGDLEREGYSVQPFVIPACAVGAPHRRDRIWIVARRIIADSHNKGLQRKRISTGHDEEKREETGQRAFQYTRDDRTTLPADRWKNFPTQSPVCSRDDGLSLGLAGISFPRWRQESVKALGNAMCPQVIYEIFRAIEISNKDGNLERHTKIQRTISSVQ